MTDPVGECWVNPQSGEILMHTHNREDYPPILSSISPSSCTYTHHNNPTLTDVPLSALTTTGRLGEGAKEMGQIYRRTAE